MQVGDWGKRAVDLGTQDKKNIMPKLNLIPFDKDHLKDYLDRCIEYWRKQRDEEKNPTAQYYIDAFQSVRTTIFGETLPPTKGMPQPIDRRHPRWPTC